MLMVMVVVCFLAGSAKVARNLRVIRSSMRVSCVVRGFSGLLPVGWIAGCAGSCRGPWFGLSCDFLRSSVVRRVYCGFLLRFWRMVL